jgi:hypothetical protein
MFENRCLTSELILEVEMLAIFCCMVIHDKLILLNKSFSSGQNSDAASNKELVMISPLVNGRSDMAISQEIF